MPFHLEKGVMGLRFDYLARSPEVRTYLTTKLQVRGADPFAVASSISIPFPGNPNIDIDALNDDISVFRNALQELWRLNQDQFDEHERREPDQYSADNDALDPRNQDTPGNRQAFVGYWQNVAKPALKEEMRQAMLKALTSNRPRIDHWWDCTQPDGDPPRVICSLDVPAVARVLFCTPHLGPVESPIRGALPAR
jgi:hypothetical protein